jgi:phosphatidate cytidylyltransferase
MIWLADIGAYFSGKRFGRIKIVKNISPGKTLEGFLGGVLSNLIFILPLHIYGFLNIFDGILLTFLVTTLSLYGDIYESFLKRMAKIKDSSNLIPGHGGFLDRMDSFCSTIPISYFLLRAFEYI